jgi:hypothetical protein
VRKVSSVQHQLASLYEWLHLEDVPKIHGNGEFGLWNTHFDTICKQRKRGLADCNWRIGAFFDGESDPNRTVLTVVVFRGPNSYNFW